MVNAGLPIKAPICGGWESRGVSGHILGYYLSACSMMYASSGDLRFINIPGDAGNVNGSSSGMPITDGSRFGQR